MKKYVIILLAFLGVAMNAQAHKISQERLDRLIEAKLRMVAERLQLTEQQQSEFSAIYTRYSNELAAQFETYRKKEVELRCNKQEKALKIMNLRFEAREKALKTQRIYYAKFEKILTPDQLLKLDIVENEIQRKIVEEWTKRKREQKRR